MDPTQVPTFEDVLKARDLIQDQVHRTPVITCHSLNEISGCELFFKAENFQKVGAFKFRGAYHAIQCLSEVEAQRGVVTHSSGNHAQALALAARMRGIEAHIVMPVTAPQVKRKAVAGYGARIIDCQPELESREAVTEEVLKDTGGTFIHPFNDSRVISGQGTATVELLEEVRDLDVILTPVGGGGLLSGAVLAVQGIQPSILVCGVEPQLADDAHQSLKIGEIQPPRPPKTIADGLLTALGNLTFAIIKDGVQDILLVSEAEILQATRHLWERAKLVVEPSGAVPFASTLRDDFPFRGKRVGIIISGGNVDLDRLQFKQS